MLPPEVRVVPGDVLQLLPVVLPVLEYADPALYPPAVEPPPLQLAGAKSTPSSHTARRARTAQRLRDMSLFPRGRACVYRRNACRRDRGYTSITRGDVITVSYHEVLASVERARSTNFLFTWRIPRWAPMARSVAHLAFHERKAQRTQILPVFLLPICMSGRGKSHSESR